MMWTLVDIDLRMRSRAAVSDIFQRAARLAFALGGTSIVRPSMSTAGILPLPFSTSRAFTEKEIRRSARTGGADSLHLCGVSRFRQAGPSPSD